MKVKTSHWHGSNLTKYHPASWSVVHNCTLTYFENYGPLHTICAFCLLVPFWLIQLSERQSRCWHVFPKSLNSLQSCESQGISAESQNGWDWKGSPAQSRLTKRSLLGPCRVWICVYPERENPQPSWAICSLTCVFPQTLFRIEVSLKSLVYSLLVSQTWDGKIWWQQVCLRKWTVS